MDNARTYRYLNISKNLVDFEVKAEETDLWIRADTELKDKALDMVLTYRNQIKDQIQKNPFFLSSLIPVDPVFPASPIVKEMISAARTAGTGPMAAVAGAMAEYVGKELLAFSKNVIVENGGDIFLSSQTPVTVRIFAGKSPLSNQIGLEIPPTNGIGICTSSGTVGHSYSRGKADAVCILSPNTSLADAVATQLGNLVHTVQDMHSAIYVGKTIEGISGILIIVKDQMAAWGNLKIVPV